MRIRYKNWYRYSALLDKTGSWTHLPGDPEICLDKKSNPTHSHEEYYWINETPPRGTTVIFLLSLLKFEGVKSELSREREKRWLGFDFRREATSEDPMIFLQLGCISHLSPFPFPIGRLICLMTMKNYPSAFWHGTSSPTDRSTCPGQIEGMWWMKQNKTCDLRIRKSIDDKRKEGGRSNGKNGKSTRSSCSSSPRWNFGMELTATSLECGSPEFVSLAKYLKARFQTCATWFLRSGEITP